MDNLMTVEEIEFPYKDEFGSLVRKRKALRIEHFKLLRMTHGQWYPSGAYYVGRDGYSCNKDEAIRLKRSWRGKRSKFIKKNCNRKFRRSSKLNMIVSRHKNIMHKATEFWWEYD